MITRIGNTRIEARHRLSCHCGRVQIEVSLPRGIDEVGRCDCSICRRKGAILAAVPLADLRVIEGEEHLETYQFHTGTAKHYFCSHCGIYTHHRSRVSPDKYDFNVGCLEGVNPLDLGEVQVFDGINHPCDNP